MDTHEKMPDRPGSARRSSPRGEAIGADRPSDENREEALDDLKEEVAEEVGVDPDRYGGNVPAKKWGALGGHMVKRLIERGEDAIAEDAPKRPPRNP